METREGDYERAVNYLHLGSVPKSQRAKKGRPSRAS
jgi:hypothetical protein